MLKITQPDIHKPLAVVYSRAKKFSKGLQQSLSIAKKDNVKKKGITRENGAVSHI